MHTFAHHCQQRCHAKFILNFHLSVGQIIVRVESISDQVSKEDEWVDHYDRHEKTSAVVHVPPGVERVLDAAS